VAGASATSAATTAKAKRKRRRLVEEMAPLLPHLGEERAGYEGQCGRAASAAEVVRLGAVPVRLTTIFPLIHGWTRQK